MNQKLFQKLEREIISSLPEFSVDFLPPSIRTENGLCTLNYALENIHFPSSEESLEKAIKRLTFNELYLFALTLSKIKVMQKSKLAPFAVFQAKKESRSLDLLSFLLVETVGIRTVPRAARGTSCSPLPLVATEEKPFA